MDVGPESGGPEFPPFEQERWAALAAKAVGGRSVDEALRSFSDDGIAIDALAPRRPAAPLGHAHGNANWTIVQRVDDPDIKRACSQAKADLDNGATGVTLVFEGAPNAFGYGLPARPDTITAVLADIAPGRIHIRIDAHPQSRTTAEWLVAVLARKRVDVTKLSLSFGIDPAAIFAGSGGLRMSIAALQASMPQSLGHFFAMGAPGILLEADGRPFHNAGASEAQELGVMIASAAFYLRMFSEARQPLHYAIPHIGFSLSVDQDQFLSVAKIRAVRKLWARVQETCAVPPFTAPVHAETSYRMMTRRDPDTNILRTTIAAFAAATGGADSICVLPHTVALGLPDAFARRIARNTQLILAGESHVGFVTDPMAGSGAIESLTDALCAAAWTEFQTIEREGGILHSLSGGHLQARIAEARDKRRAQYRDGSRSIVGTTLFRQASERVQSTLAAEQRAIPVDAVATCEPLPPIRLDDILDVQA